MRYRLQGPIAFALDGLRAMWRTTRDQAALKSMSDAELRDLGIGRSQIPALRAAHGPRGNAAA